jgi:hypothetical protein
MPERKIHISELRPGDQYRIYNREMSSQGEIERVNRTTFGVRWPQSDWLVRTRPDLYPDGYSHSKLDKRHFYGARIFRDGELFTVAEWKRGD